MAVTPVAAAGTIQSAIALASSRTGIDFDYLLGQAQVESGLNARAAAGTSSARGLYQFIEQSWLSVVKQHGAEHGLGWAADSIQRGANGKFSVDPALRQQILGLRNDPTAASLMAAEHASDNKTALEGSLGRTATGTDLYMAHFLGLGGAKQFLGAMQANPDRAGAAMFPSAARANRNIFYAADGSQRSLGDIYQRFAAKLDKGAAAGGATTLASDGVGKANPIAALYQVAGSEIVAGAGETQDQATRWATATLERLQGKSGQPVNLLRPTPDTARLAYLMLARLGG
ncbi:MAG: lytic transglycosylase domain-containing protein [Pseudomonadota bacterium]